MQRQCLFDKKMTPPSVNDANVTAHFAMKMPMTDCWVEQGVVAYTCYPDAGKVKWKPFELYLLESLSLTTYLHAYVHA